MITDIKTFIADAKELYPDFSFEEYDEKASFEEKFEFFKRLNTSLKIKYGRGYFKTKEEFEKFWDDEEQCADLPVANKETIIIYSLYSSETDYRDLEYRVEVIKQLEVPTIVANHIIDEYFDNPGQIDESCVGWMEGVMYNAELSYESLIHFNYKAKVIHTLWYDGLFISDLEIDDVDTLRMECKELLKRDLKAYEDICFAIIDLWESEDVSEFAKSESNRIRWNACHQSNCPKEVLEELLHDKCDEIVDSVKYILGM